MRVKIYLRSIEQDEKKLLAMFDSKRQGDINNLTTEVYAGDKIIWKLDCCSGIKSIAKIYPKEGKGNIFKNDPVRQLLCKGIVLQVPEYKVEIEEVEAYTIEYILCDDTKMVIDPYIKILPPPVKK
jgi:hypothetical protein